MSGGRKKFRCAIYTRKSTEEGLEQDFNSLDAQREACAAYIKAQEQEGWLQLPERYDDGGCSGGTLGRPALQRLLDEVRARRIDIIVVYKIDRLTRALTDFARLADLFDEHGVSFVSVTQQFNTTTSMGRLMLNVLLSFAQFEREVTGERIRDKIAASKAKGMWMGGFVPVGYQPKGRTLVIDHDESKRIRKLFELYLEFGSVRALKAEADRQGLTTRTGGNFSRGHLYCILQNPIYIGQIPHKDKRYPGLHKAIIDLSTWDKVQKKLADNRYGSRSKHQVKVTSPLVGLLFDEHGNRYTPTFTVRGKRRYRYYVRHVPTAVDDGADQLPRRIPAPEIEAIVQDRIAKFLGEPTRLLDALGDDLEPDQVSGVLQSADRIGSEIAKSIVYSGATSIRAFIDRILLGPEDVRIQLNVAKLRAALGVPTLTEEMAAASHQDCQELVVPTRVRLRGSCIKLVVGNRHKGRARGKDDALIKAVVRAHDWLERLKSGEARSISEIAKDEGLTGSYVTRVIRLAFLSPDTIEAILDGRQAVGLTAERLTLHEEIHFQWINQQAPIG